MEIISSQLLFCSNKDKIFKQKGFTLFELAVVIVIIALITVGVVSGKNLVTGAKLRSVVSDLQEYSAAINTFRSTYDAVPGDFNSAWSYWGSACGNNVQAQCDGSGNNYIDNSGGVSVREDVVAWQHLALAQLLPGSWTWESNDTILGKNIIPSPVGRNTGYWLTYTSLYFGSRRSAGQYFNGEALTPNEALAIDSKADDSRPGVGKIITFRDQDQWNVGTICIDQPFNAAAAVFKTANYILTDTTVSCTLTYVFR